MARRVLTTSIAAAGIALVLASGAEAATFVVNNPGDQPDAEPADTVCETAPGNGVCTLRAAIGQANGSGSPGPDTVGFSVTGAIELGTPLPTIAEALDIDGPGAAQLTVRRAPGAPEFTIFFSSVPEGTPVSIGGLTITGGIGVGNSGGGITNNGAALTVREAVVTGNEATGKGVLSDFTSPANGGGIRSSGGSLVVIESTISGNAANGRAGFVFSGSPQPGQSGRGGGIFSVGPLTLTRSTVSGNSVTGGNGAPGAAVPFSDGSAGGDAQGAGIFVQAFWDPVPVVIENSTVSGNTAGPAGAGGPAGHVDGVEGPSGIAQGGGIHLDSTLVNQPLTAALTNSTIAGNAAPAGANLQLRGGIGESTATIRGSVLADPLGSANCAIGTTRATITSNGFNLEDANPSSCSLNQATDIVGPDPGLGPLAANGGPTQTHALTAASPAIDKGHSSGLTVDQRGLARPFGFGTVADALGGDGSDIGAFELRAPACADGNDNDSDGRIDLADPDCTDAADDDETGPSDPPPPAPKCAGKDATIVAVAGIPTQGTPGADVIVGTTGDDKIRAGGGKDTICARAGKDVVQAGGGNDTVKAAGGNDRVTGGAGRDTLAGGGGKDRLRGAAGNDRLKGNAGNDNLAGGPGRDRLNGGPGRDRCAGEPGGVTACEA